MTTGATDDGRPEALPMGTGSTGSLSVGTTNSGLPESCPDVSLGAILRGQKGPAD